MKKTAFNISFRVSKTVYLDEEKIKEGMSRSLPDFKDSEIGFLMIDIAKAIVKAELEQRLENEDESQRSDFKIKYDGGSRENI